MARRDRSDNSGWGGVAVLVKTDFAGSVVLLAESGSAERLWLTLHANQGPYLLCVWYRPPAPGDTEGITSFKEEYNQHSRGALGSLVVGDLNVHNCSWLRHSARNTLEGRTLEETCRELGLRQRVREPTRRDNDTGHNYLLDLVLTNLEEVGCTVEPGVSDHKLVSTTLQLTAPKELSLHRVVWDFRKAQWDLLRFKLENARWDFLEELDPDRATETFTGLLLQCLQECVPQRVLQEKKRTHPWLTDRVLQLVDKKKAAAGTTREREAAVACSQGILEEYWKYVARVREELATLRAGTKKWWTKTQELLQGKSKTCSVPALKSAEGGWVTTAKGKADLLAETFSEKNTLPEAEENCYTTLAREEVQEDWEPTGQKTTEEVLDNLRDESATGPDLVPTRLLHHCARELAKPLHRLARRILETGHWPKHWLQHWVIPLYKRKAVWNPHNYRGIHLTAQLAKCTERVLQQAFGKYLCSDKASGLNQFAYKQKKGARDVLALLLLTWIQGFNNRRKFAVYCADVSGAFDRVKTTRLLQKLEAKGVPSRWLALFGSWLRERPAQVAVGGSYSETLTLHDMVFQGTVWGPLLWNVFFADVADAVRKTGFTEVVFADDCNAYKEVPKTTATEEALAQAQACQQEVHKWGGANHVTFDPEKESFHVLSAQGSTSETFKTLGVEIDGALTMEKTVRKTATEAHWKLRTLERSSRFQCDRQLVLLYKARVLSYLEYRTAAVYHATDTVLQTLDAVQDTFLRKLGISDLEALMVFNLAPLTARRDITMLGVIHRAVLGEGPEQLKSFFQVDRNQRNNTTRAAQRRHGKQLVEHRRGRFLEVLRRSALGLVAVYNRLPPAVVEEKTVKAFQVQLANLLKERAAGGQEDWKLTLSPRIPLWRHPLR